MLKQDVGLVPVNSKQGVARADYQSGICAEHLENCAILKVLLPKGTHMSACSECLFSVTDYESKPVVQHLQHSP